MNISTKIAFALTLSFLVGVIQLVLGLLRFGLIIEFVNVPVISGFTTGAAVQIIIGQLPSLTGIKGVDTTQPAYLVLSSWLSKLPNLGAGRHDLAFGISALLVIVLIKYSSRYLEKRVHPGFRYLGLLRNGFAVVFFTLISYLVRDKVTVSLTGFVPSGLAGISQPDFSSSFITSVLKSVPAVLIVSVLEHIAVSKSFGRVNGYKPDDNQEVKSMMFFLFFLESYFIGGNNTSLLPYSWLPLVSLI